MLGNNLKIENGWIWRDNLKLSISAFNCLNSSYFPPSDCERCNTQNVDVLVRVSFGGTFTVSRKPELQLEAETGGILQSSVFSYFLSSNSRIYLDTRSLLFL